MMKRALAVLLTSCVAQIADAQTWSGPGQQPISYPTSGGSWTGVIGDGTTAQGGDAPAYATEPADIDAATAGYTYSQWVPTTGISRTTGSGEDKVRFVCNSSHAAQEDPILFPGQANAGHMHEFVGNSLAGKDSTYSTLRMTGKSTCPGGPINRTAYWKPALMKELKSGVSVVIRSDLEIFYYSHASAASFKKTRIPNGFAFIGGVNPADPTNAAFKAAIPAGFSQASFYGPNNDGFKGWVCMLSNGTFPNNVTGSANAYPALQTPEGNDPWQGNCVEGSTLYAEVIAPLCWDGKNRTSPDGRSHVRYPIMHSGSERCPTGWWEVPTFIAKSDYSVGVGGWADYRHWYLSSDRHGLSKANWRRPGSTFHFDWMNGWDPTALFKWQNECTGVKIGATAGNGGGCDSATIGTNARLLAAGEASPDTSLSNNPVVNQSIRYYNDGAGRFYPVRGGTTGTLAHLTHGVIPTGEAPTVSNERYVVAEGDSISLTSALFYPNVYDTNRSRVTVCGQATSGAGITQVAARSGNIANCGGTGSNKAEVVTLLIGANDMPHGDQTSWFNNIWAYTDALRAQGIKVAMGTLLPKGPPVSDYVSFNTYRANANTTIRAAVGTHIDAVIDFAANSTIGDDADGSNTTLYPDGLHPSSTAHATMATIYSAVVDALLNISGS